MRFQGFGEGAITFFEQLAANNTRTWWQANRRWYEDDVRAPLEYLLDDLSAEFGEAKVFRPNRDTRFSRDKSPYKTSAAAVGVFSYPPAPWLHTARVRDLVAERWRALGPLNQWMDANVGPSDLAASAR